MQKCIGNMTFMEPTISVLRINYRLLLPISISFYFFKNTKSSSSQREILKNVSIGFHFLLQQIQIQVMKNLRLVSIYRRLCNTVWRMYTLIQILYLFIVLYVIICSLNYFYGSRYPKLKGKRKKKYG